MMISRLTIKTKDIAKDCPTAGRLSFLDPNRLKIPLLISVAAHVERDCFKFSKISLISHVVWTNSRSSLAELVQVVKHRSF